jgi:hypothetical protein
VFLVKPDAVAVENVLRLARSESGAALAFAALGTCADDLRVFSVPDADEHTLVGHEALAELVCQASTDPELPHARVLVRAVGASAPLTLAVAAAPVADGLLRRAAASGASTILLAHDALAHDEPRALVGLLFEAEHELDETGRELLAQLAERLWRHARARRQVALLGERSSSSARADALHADERGGRTAAEGAEGVVSEEWYEEGHTLVRDIFEPEDPTEWSAVGQPEMSGGGGGDRLVPAVGPPRAVAWRCPPGAAARGWRRSESRPSGPVQGQLEVAPLESSGIGDVGQWWLVHDVVTGLPSVAQFCSQVGRLLAAEIRATSSLALVLVEVPGERAAPAAARALGAQLRYSDPLARIDRDLFAAAMLLVPGHGCADAVEARLASAARSSLHELSTVRTTHAVAAPGDRRDVDELLRQAIAQLPGRAGAAEPPGGGRGAPPLGSPSAMATS